VQNGRPVQIDGRKRFLVCRVCYGGRPPSWGPAGGAKRTSIVADFGDGISTIGIAGRAPHLRDECSVQCIQVVHTQASALTDNRVSRQGRQRIHNRAQRGWRAAEM
jgi:hypothetical protein